MDTRDQADGTGDATGQRPETAGANARRAREVAAALPARLPRHSALIVGLVSTGAFVGQLDATIVQLALPTLARTFDAPLEHVSWVSLAYLVAFAACLPVFGRLCQMYGRKTLYLAGYVLFVGASALCAMAPDLGSLIAARVAQGMGGALLGANSIAILVSSVPEESRGRALGVFAAAQAVGMSAGPAVGGVVLGLFGWPWIFWLTVPFGIVAAAVGWLALPQTGGTRADQGFDWMGALLLAPALVLLVRALNHAAAWGLTSVETLGSFAAAALLFAVLVRQERRAPSPLVDLRLFASPGFSPGAAAVVLAYAMLYAMFFLMSFLLEHGYGDRAWAAGARLAIIPVVLGIVAPFSGGLSTRLGIRVLGLAGMGLCGLALALLSIVLADPDANRMLDSVAFAVFGAGLGLFVAPNNHATLAAAPTALATQAGALLNLMRVLGTSLGVAGATSTLSLGIAGAIGRHADTPVTGPALIVAVESGLALVAAMAFAAALLCVVRRRPAPQA
ncbi:MFS transporter [Xanthobacter sp. KR7-65]|uniref:MFS transporter n=1 Tax=Xanthobacter sp. KR7-65 TaxID=3156612 RepID=UPI0032B4CF37